MGPSFLPSSAAAANANARAAWTPKQEGRCYLQHLDFEAGGEAERMQLSLAAAYGLTLSGNNKTSGLTLLAPSLVPMPPPSFI